MTTLDSVTSDPTPSESAPDGQPAAGSDILSEMRAANQAVFQDILREGVEGLPNDASIIARLDSLIELLFPPDHPFRQVLDMRYEERMGQYLTTILSQVRQQKLTEGVAGAQRSLEIV